MKGKLFDSTYHHQTLEKPLISLGSTAFFFGVSRYRRANAPGQI